MRRIWSFFLFVYHSACPSLLTSLSLPLPRMIMFLLARLAHVSKIPVISVHPNAKLLGFCVFGWASFSLRLFEILVPDKPLCALSPPLTNSVKHGCPSFRQITTTFAVCQSAPSVSSYHWERVGRCYFERKPLGNVETINEKPNWWWHETSSALERNPRPNVIF